jgi:penicillin-binding protein 1A
MLKGGLDEGGTSSNLWVYDLFKGGKEPNELGGKTGTSSNHSDGWFVGVSKDLVGGSWVGGEDRCIHFRSTEQGEGAKTALPIFGLFMERVYKNEAIGITKGRFPKPSVKISKPYNCHTRIKKTKKDDVDSADAGN